MTLENKLENAKSLLIIVDAEGCTGIRDLSDVAMSEIDDTPTPTVQKAMADDVNALLKGAYMAGIRKAYVLDGHATGKNIKKRHLKKLKGMRVVLKSELPRTLKKYARKADLAAMIGMHGKYGSDDGDPPMYLGDKRNGLAHTYIFGIQDAYLNGVSRGESVIYMHILKDLGVPLIFVSGSKAATDELHSFAPVVSTVATKEGKYLWPAETVRQSIKDGIEKAIYQAKEGKGFVDLDDSLWDYRSFEFQFKQPEHYKEEAKLMNQLDPFRKFEKKGKVKLDESARTVTFTGPSYFDDHKIVYDALGDMGILKSSIVYKFFESIQNAFKRQ